MSFLLDNHKWHVLRNANFCWGWIQVYVLGSGSTFSKCGSEYPDPLLLKVDPRIRIHFSKCGSQDPDPDPGQNEMDPKRCYIGSKTCLWRKIIFVPGKSKPKLTTVWVNQLKNVADAGRTRARLLEQSPLVPYITPTRQSLTSKDH